MSLPQITGGGHIIFIRLQCRLGGSVQVECKLSVTSREDYAHRWDLTPHALPWQKLVEDRRLAADAEVPAGFVYVPRLISRLHDSILELIVGRVCTGVVLQEMLQVERSNPCT